MPPSKLHIVQCETTPTYEKVAKPRGRKDTRKANKFIRKSCLNKKRFHSQEHAKEFILGFRYGSSKNFGREIHLRAYQCSFCNGWHTTSQTFEQPEVA